MNKPKTFDSPLGEIAVTYREDGLILVEFLERPDAAGYGEFFYARDWHEIRSTLGQRAELERLAELGKELAEREDDELDRLDLAPAVTDFLTGVLPERAALRSRARLLIDLLDRNGYTVEFRNLAVRVDPEPPADLASLVRELEPYIADILTENV